MCRLDVRHRETTATAEDARAPAAAPAEMLEPNSPSLSSSRRASFRTLIALARRRSSGRPPMPRMDLAR